MTATAAAALVLLLIGTSRFEQPAPAPATPQPVQRAVSPEASRAPERPRAIVDVGAVRPSGRTLRVAAGANLQQAIDDARPGDLIAVEAGATYQGPFRLRRKEGNGWITIASAAESQLPKPGTRVSPSHASRMPKLVGSGDSVIQAEPGAHHYRLVGLEIAPAAGEYVRDVVQLGVDERSTEQQPHNIRIERSYIHGDPKRGSRRGVALNSRQTTVIDSHLSDFKEVGADSQAIAGWNGAGPFRIANNYLEAAGENIMFGGADPAVPDLVPADIEILRNHLAKPRRWKKDDPTFEGTEWAVKNLFELKNARRVLANGNVLEYNWPHAQNGFAILFTVRNQDGRSPWSVVEDVTFSNNIVRHVAAGINILGKDDIHDSQQTRRIAIRNNLFVDIGGTWGHGRLFQLLDGTRDVVIEHNTATHTGNGLFGGDRTPHAGFVFRNNVMPQNELGIIGSSTAPGAPSLERYFPGAVVRGNVIIGGTPGQYPPDNSFARSLADVASGNLARQGADGRAPGADLDALKKATSGVAPGDGAIVTAQLIGLDGGSPLVAFWAALLLLAYIYLGYPVVARIRAALRPRTRVRAPIEPSVTVIVVAYNEADRIERRIENLLSLDYPRERIEIIIGSDGSTDDTVARALRFATFGVKVQAFDRRRGKPAVLNALVPAARGEIVIFADARQQFDDRAVRTLVANFADPSAGAVSGQLVLAVHRDAGTATQGSAFYWRYEKFIRSTEGRADSTVGATGAIYAIRRELFEAIPDDTVLDDVLIPLRIVRRGYRVLFEPDARAYDQPSSTGRQEFVRKVRTIAGTFQLFARETWLFNPLRNRLWFETMSHKALRLTIPALHVVLLAANAALLDVPLFRWTMAGQVVFYAAALAGYAQQHARRRLILFSVPYTIVLLLWATAVGFVRFVTQRQQVTWERITALQPPASLAPVPLPVALPLPLPVALPLPLPVPVPDRLPGQQAQAPQPQPHLH